MALLILDIEGSGLPNPLLPPEDPTQPWPIAIAADLCDDNGRSISHMNIRIRADGRKVDAGATEVHGITSREADKTGVNEVVALALLLNLASDAEKIIGFGLGYDRGVILGSVIRHNRDPRKWQRPGLQFVDLIPAAAAACRFETEHDSNAYRWPKLVEAHDKLIGVNTRLRPHDAWADCGRAKEVYLYLMDHRLLEATP